MPALLDCQTIHTYSKCSVPVGWLSTSSDESVKTHGKSGGKIDKIMRLEKRWIRSKDTIGRKVVTLGLVQTCAGLWVTPADAGSKGCTPSKSKKNEQLLTKSTFDQNENHYYRYSSSLFLWQSRGPFITRSFSLQRGVSFLFARF